MQIAIPSVPDELTDCVVTAIVVDVLATLLFAGAGAAIPGLISLVLAGATYRFVYRNLRLHAEATPFAAAIIAIIHVFFAVAALATRNPIGFAMDGIVAVCLGFVFLELRNPVSAWPKRS